MDRDDILDALTRLGERLDARGLRADLYVVGGAAMALAYDMRRTTKDVDAVFEPKAEVYREAIALAPDLGLPADWLNDGVKGFLLSQDAGACDAFEAHGIRVQVGSPEMLLVLKCLAHRMEDEPDARVLADLAGLRTAEEVLDHVVRIAGESRVTAQTQFFVEQVFDQA